MLHTRFFRFALGMLAVGFSSPLPHCNANALRPENRHNVHVTKGRMVVEGAVAVARIRFFRHDLEAALAAFRRSESFSVSNTPSSDSLFLDYLNSGFSLTARGDTLLPEIVSSGEDDEVWWYELRFSDDAAITSLKVRNEMLLEIFSDQKHFLKITFFPSGKSESLYFAKGAVEYEIGIE